MIGFALSFPCQNGKTALYWAVEKGNATMVRDILQCNPDTESCTKVHGYSVVEKSDSLSVILLYFLIVISKVSCFSLYFIPFFIYITVITKEICCKKYC